jgi:hypothetical protein
MALDINKLSELRVIDKAAGLHILEVQSNVIKWLHDNVGNMNRVDERMYIDRVACIHYYGDGWEITPPTGMRPSQGYKLIINNDIPAVQFKLTWL